ncbi:MAG: hypothetical protein Fur0032_19890 [Terrimicrobiaceae bacterium]
MSPLEQPGSEGGKSSAARFCLIVVGCLIVFAVLFHAPVLLREPSNADEFIYLTLASQLARGGPYSLQGTRILEALPASMYDHATFNHPPGFAALLLPWASSPRGAVWVSMGAVVLAVGAVGWASWSQLLSGADSMVRRTLFVLPVLATATDPILSFCARRVWPDAMICGLLALVLAGGVSFLNGGKPMPLWVAGLALAGAVSMKLIVGYWLLPLAILVFLRSRKMSDLVAVVVPAVLVLVAWEVFFFAKTGELWPHWLRIDADAQQSNKFMAARVAQPWTFFPLTWLILVPLSGLTMGAAFLSMKNSPVVRILLPSCLMFLLVLMILGGSGVSKEARYLAPLTPALSILLAAVFSHHADHFSMRRQTFAIACLLTIVAGASTAGFHLTAIRMDEPVHPWMLK